MWLAIKACRPPWRSPGDWSCEQEPLRFAVRQVRPSPANIAAANPVLATARGSRVRSTRPSRPDNSFVDAALRRAKDDRESPLLRWENSARSVEKRPEVFEAVQWSASD